MHLLLSPRISINPNLSLGRLFIRSGFNMYVKADKAKLTLMLVCWACVTWPGMGWIG